MAVRARMRMGDVEIEHFPPVKGDKRRVNVPASSQLFDAINTWVARIRAEVVYSLDGTLMKIREGDAERMVAAWAAVNHEGDREGAHMGVGDRDNYMAELAAQLAVARSGWTRAVIVMDATSPVLALWSFMSGCDRRKQRKYRRDWLDTWERWLHGFEAVVFVWQTSHVGASINDWPDELAAEIAETGDISEHIELQPGRYATLEVAAGGSDTPGGQIVKEGVWQWALRLLSAEVLRRLRSTSQKTQTRLVTDFNLPRLPPRLEDTSERLLAARLQLGDSRMHHSKMAMALITEAGFCPFGCGCKFTWWDVAFKCRGAEVVQQRAAWLVCVKEAREALIGGTPHVEWGQLLSLLDGSARAATYTYEEGSPCERSIRRLVGGCVKPTSERLGGQGEADLVRVLSQAHEAGIRLQQAAWEQARWLRDLVATQVKELAKVRPLAQRWRMAVIRGGPKRASMLSEAAAARRDTKINLAAALLQGRRLAADEVSGLLTRAEMRIGRHMLLARSEFTTVSHRAALREWRWLAMLRHWRLKAAPRGLPVFEPVSAVQTDLFNWVATWAADVCTRGTARHVPAADVWSGWAGRSAHARDGLEGRALTPHSKLRWAGDRRLYDKLKGVAVQAGHEPDRFGFWAVKELIEVRLPARRRGRQLEVLVNFAGCDPIRPREWVPITLLKPDVKREAREMEARLATAAPQPARARNKRSWAGLGWEGADEGLPRRGRSGRIAESTVGAAAVQVTPVAAAVTAPPLVAVFAIPAGGPPADTAVALAQPIPFGVTFARPVPEGEGNEATHMDVDLTAGT